MSDSENTNYIENDSEDSFHPDEESSSNDSDEPSASSKRPKNSRKRSSVSIFTSTPRNSASHRLSKTLPRMPSLDSSPLAAAPHNLTPKLSPGEETIMQYLKKMDSKIDKIGEEIKTLKEEIGTGMKGKGKKSEQENFHVPPKIRTAVHDAYKQLVEEDDYAAWQTKLGDNKLKVSSEVNKATTQAVKQFVKGLYHDVQDGILQTAVARYFESVAQKEHKEKTGKIEQHKAKMLHYSRRKRKLQWRMAMVEKKTGWDEAKKRRISNALELCYMSSEEENNSDDETFLKTKPLSWRSEEYTKILEELDTKYERSMSNRSKRQMLKRVKGDMPSVRPKPIVKKEHEWVFAQ